MENTTEVLEEQQIEVQDQPATETAEEITGPPEFSNEDANEDDVDASDEDEDDDDEDYDNEDLDEDDDEDDDEPEDDDDDSFDGY